LTRDADFVVVSGSLRCRGTSVLFRFGIRPPSESYVPSYHFAIIHAGLGENDRAFEWLERAYQGRSTVLAYMRIDPRLAPLRSDARYAKLVRRIGFPS